LLAPIASLRAWPENRWIGQTIDRDGDGSVDHTRWFGYDGQQMLVQFDREGGGRLTAQDQSYRYLWGPAVDQILADEQLFPLATEEGTSASFPLPPGEGQGEGYDLRTPGRVLWPLADHLGTVRDLAQYDAESAMTAVVDHRQYDSFGNFVSAIDPATNQPAAVDFLFGFTGRPLDSATGLENDTNRWYDAAVGGWLSPDPLGFSAGDANLYRYVGNQLTHAIDTEGLLGILMYLWLTDPRVYIYCKWTDAGGNSQEAWGEGAAFLRATIGNIERAGGVINVLIMKGHGALDGGGYPSTLLVTDGRVTSPTGPNRAGLQLADDLTAAFCRVTNGDTHIVLTGCFTAATANELARILNNGANVAGKHFLSVSIPWTYKSIGFTSTYRYVPAEPPRRPEPPSLPPGSGLDWGGPIGP